MLNTSGQKFHRTSSLPVNEHNSHSASDRRSYDEWFIAAASLIDAEQDGIQHRQEKQITATCKHSLLPVLLEYPRSLLRPVFFWQFLTVITNHKILIIKKIILIIIFDMIQEIYDWVTDRLWVTCIGWKTKSLSRAWFLTHLFDSNWQVLYLYLKMVPAFSALFLPCIM